MISLKRGTVALGVIATLAMSLAPATGASLKTDNVKLIKRFKYTGGAELDYDGSKYLYASEIDGITRRGEKRGKGGVHIYDIRKEVPKEVGFIACAGNDNDVAVVKPGLLAVAYHQNVCNLGRQGVSFFDVKNPKSPKRVGDIAVPSAHTITVYPGKPLVYISPGGLANGSARFPIQIVDVSNPRKPKIAASYFPDGTAGCHDISFSFVGERKLAFCAGGGGVQIWDVRNPLAPKFISQIVNPLIQFPHYGLASPDGKLLVIDDEAFVAHECVTGQSPAGAAFFYDISVPEVPVPVGRFAPKRGKQPVGHELGWTQSWCTSHHYNFVPGTRNLVISWFTGGTSVLDLSNPTLPVETAVYAEEDSNAYTSHWFDGRIFVNDMHRGLEVLKVKGLKEK